MKAIFKFLFSVGVFSFVLYALYLFYEKFIKIGDDDTEDSLSDEEDTEYYTDIPFSERVKAAAKKQLAKI